MGADMDGLTLTDEDDLSKKEEKEKTHLVDIEVEEYYEVTSEEEDVGAISSNKKRFGATNSQHGS